MRRSLSVLVLFGALLLGGGSTPAWAAPPANDTYATAQEVAVPSITGPVDTTEATVDAVDAEVAAQCFGIEASSTVWYRFTSAEEALVLVDTSASDHDVSGAVVTGAPGSFSTVSCFGGSTVIPAQPGTEYFVVLADPVWDGGGGGMVTLELSTGERPTGDVTVKSGTVAKKTGVATITGTITCAEGAFAGVYGQLSQAVGRVNVIRGWGGTGVECDGSAQVWSIDVRPENGRFAGGKATFDWYMDVWSPFGYDSGYGTSTIKLRAK